MTFGERCTASDYMSSSEAILRSTLSDQSRPDDQSQPTRVGATPQQELGDPATQQNPPFAFAISLQSRAVSNQWDAVESNLRHTLRSIRASRNVDPMIIIACHDAPDLKDDGCKNLQILPVPFAPELAVSQRIADKFRKLRFIGAWLKSTIPFDGIYVMFLDADDLVHKDLAAYVLDNDNRRSYLVDKGYRFDCSSGLLDRRSTEFYRVCASSFICYFRKEELPRSWEDADCAYAKFGVHPNGHGQYGLVAARLGKHSDAIPFYAVTYMMNHGESLRTWKIGRRVRYLSIRDLVRPSQAKRILADDFSFETRDWATWTMREWARIVSVMFSACFHKACGKLRPLVQNRAFAASGGTKNGTSSST